MVRYQHLPNAEDCLGIGRLPQTVIDEVGQIQEMPRPIDGIAQGSDQEVQ